MRRLFVLLGLAALAAAPALPDLIDVIVSGTVSSSGYISAVCGLATPGCIAGGNGAPNLLTVPYSFSATNTQLGAFSQSWLAENPIAGSITSYADEDTSVCLASCPPTGMGDAIEVELSGGHSGGLFYSAFEAADVSISFDLTEESEATLYTAVEPSSGALLDSNGNVILPIPLDGPASALLQPGTYQLNDSAGGGSQEPYLMGNVTDFQTYLYADFVPVPTPEPRGAIFAAAFAMIAGGCVLSRRRRA